MCNAIAHVWDSIQLSENDSDVLDDEPWLFFRVHKELHLRLSIIGYADRVFNLELGMTTLVPLELCMLLL